MDSSDEPIPEYLRALLPQPPGAQLGTPHNPGTAPSIKWLAVALAGVGAQQLVS